MCISRKPITPRTRVRAFQKVGLTDVADSLKHAAVQWKSWRCSIDWNMIRRAWDRFSTDRHNVGLE